jgi:hypothetical protein
MIENPELWAVGLAYGGTFIGWVVWAVRLEGRISQHDTLIAKNEEINSLRYETLRLQLSTMESKLDRVLEMR